MSDPIRFAFNLNDYATIVPTEEGVALLRACDRYVVREPLVVGQPYRDQAWKLLNALGPGMLVSRGPVTQGNVVIFEREADAPPTASDETRLAEIRARVAYSDMEGPTDRADLGFLLGLLDGRTRDLADSRTGRATTMVELATDLGLYTRAAADRGAWGWLRGEVRRVLRERGALAAEVAELHALLTASRDVIAAWGEVPERSMPGRTDAAIARLQTAIAALTPPADPG